MSVVLRPPSGPGRFALRPLQTGPASGGIVRTLADPALRAPIVVVTVASVAQGLFVVLFVFFVTDVIHGSPTDVGLLRGMQGVGAIAAGALLGALGARLHLLRLTVLGTIAFTVVVP